jgi:hypothetical protein|tara:strand:- start:167 stop:487 length:321 start_codon:yes stop_codon:yes gene_type:complete
LENTPETQPETHSETPAQRSERVELSTKVEFVGDFDILQATGVNLSESGICFDIEETLPFEMRLEWEGEPYRYRAHLVWMKRLPEGGFRVGLKFVPPEQNDQSDLI